MLEKCVVQTLTIHQLMHVERRYRCLVQSLEQAVRKKEHFVLHQMVEHQNPTRLYVLQSLIKETRSKLPIDK